MCCDKKGFGWGVGLSIGEGESCLGVRVGLELSGDGKGQVVLMTI